MTAPGAVRRRPVQRGEAAGLAARYAVLAVLAATVLVPLASVVVTALHPPEAAVKGLSWPSTVSLESFRNAWTTANFGTLMTTSGVVALVVVPTALTLSTLAGYGLAVLGMPGGRVVLGVFLAGLTLPLEIIVIPLYYDLRSVGLTDSIWGLIVVETATLLPFGVYWMHASFAGFPREIVEAAHVDGASDGVTLRRVLLPLSGPALTTLAVLYFMWSWNQFLLVLILISDPTRRTAPAGLGFFVQQHTRDLPSLCAASLIVIAPIVLVYLVFQRKFISGMLQGSVKG